MQMAWIFIPLYLRKISVCISKSLWSNSENQKCLNTGKYWYSFILIMLTHIRNNEAPVNVIILEPIIFILICHFFVVLRISCLLNKKMQKNKKGRNRRKLF